MDKVNEIRARLFLWLEPTLAGLHDPKELEASWHNQGLRLLDDACPLGLRQHLLRHSWQMMYNSARLLSGFFRKARPLIREILSRESGYPGLKDCLTIFVTGSVAKCEATSRSDLDCDIIFSNGHRRNLIRNVLSVPLEAKGITGEPPPPISVDTLTEELRTGRYDLVAKITLRAYCVFNERMFARMRMDTLAQIRGSDLLRARRELLEREQENVRKKTVEVFQNAASQSRVPQEPKLRKSLYHVVSYSLECIAIYFGQLELASRPYWKIANDLRDCE